MIPAEYLRVEIYKNPSSFILGYSALGSAVLGSASGEDWLDVTCNLVAVNIRLGGRESGLSSAMGAGHLSMTARNDLNPVADTTIHPGLPVRVIDTRGNDIVLWSGHLDDLYTQYEKETGDWVIRLSASDIVRDLRNATVRGMPGNLAGTAPIARCSERITELADRIGAGVQTMPIDGSWTLTNIPTTGWTRYGSASLPSGITTGTIDPIASYAVVNDSFTSGAAEPSMTPYAYGIQRTLTGLTLGDLYVFSVDVRHSSGQNYGRDLTDFDTFGVWATAGGQNTYGITDSIRIKNKPRNRRLWVGFRANQTSMTIRVSRAFEGQVSQGRDTGGNQSHAWNVNNARLHHWSMPPAGTALPLQPVAYESSAFNHLTMACDSSGWLWCVNELNQLRGVIRSMAGGTAVQFSDEHSNASSHECYTHLDRGMDTADTVNALQIENKGRKGSQELVDGWVVADETLDLENASSINTYRRREERLDTQLHSGHVNTRVNQLWALHATPSEVFRSLTVDGVDRPGAVRRVKILSRVGVTHKDVSGTYFVTGITHRITPTEHTTHYELLPQS